MPCYSESEKYIIIDTYMYVHDGLIYREEMLCVSVVCGRWE